MEKFFEKKGFLLKENKIKFDFASRRFEMKKSFKLFMAHKGVIKLSTF
jgi:hypothetical protein